MARREPRLSCSMLSLKRLLSVLIIIKFIQIILYMMVRPPYLNEFVHNNFLENDEASGINISGRSSGRSRKREEQRRNF